MDGETCREYVSGAGRGGFGGGTCGRPVKDEGMCGLHLAGKRRRAANDEARRAKAADEAARKATAQRACADLAELGIEAKPDYDGVFIHGYTGLIVVDGDAVLRALQGLQP